MKADTSQMCVLCGAPGRETVPAPRKGYSRCRGCGLVRLETGGAAAAIIEHYEKRDPVERVSLSRSGMYAGLLYEAEARTGGTGSLLDVGCSRGDFIEHAAERGWEAFGVEPVEGLAAEASGRGLRVVAGVLEQIPPDWGPFDLITYWDTFMFVDDPVLEMEIAVSLLADSGWIYMRLRQHTVHDLLYRFWRGMGRRLKLPDFSVFHPLNFTPRTLRVLAERLGLKVEVTSSPLTRGDPYGMHSSPLPVAAAKFMVSGIAGTARLLSGGRWVVSTSMDIWMRTQRASSDS